MGKSCEHTKVVWIEKALGARRTLHRSHSMTTLEFLNGRNYVKDVEGIHFLSWLGSWVTPALILTFPILLGKSHSSLGLGFPICKMKPLNYIVVKCNSVLKLFLRLPLQWCVITEFSGVSDNSKARGMTEVIGGGCWEVGRVGSPRIGLSPQIIGWLA